MNGQRWRRSDRRRTEVWSRVQIQNGGISLEKAEGLEGSFGGSARYWGGINKRRMG